MSPRARKSDLTLEQSKRLTAEIHNCLIVTAQKIEKFISGRGWMPMGYDNFSEWYKAYIITIEFTEEKRADFLRIAGSSSEMIRLAREFIEQGFEELS